MQPVYLRKKVFTQVFTQVLWGYLPFYQEGYCPFWFEFSQKFRMISQI